MLAALVNAVGLAVMAVVIFWGSNTALTKS